MRSAFVGSLLLALLSVLPGCKTARYHLDVIEEIHDDNFNLKYEIAVESPTDRALRELSSLLSKSAPEIKPERVKNPGMRLQRSILATSRTQPANTGQYGRTIAVLTPVSALSENAMSRALALDLMVFHYQKRHDPSYGVPAANADADTATAEEALGGLSEELTAFRENPSDASAVEAVRQSIRTLGDVTYRTWRDAAAVLRLCSSLYPSRSYAPLRDDLARAIHRVAPQAIRIALVSALSTREVIFVREEAAEGLGLIGDAAAIPQLNRVVVRDRSEDVRRRAAQALGRLDDETAIPSLIDVLELDEDPGVRWNARRALVHITDTDQGDDSESWRDWLRSSQDEKAE